MNEGAVMWGLPGVAPELAKGTVKVALNVAACQRTLLTTYREARRLRCRAPGVVRPKGLIR